MTRSELHTVEDVLVELAAVSCHIETAVIFMDRGRQRQAMIELRQALLAQHKVKLRIMAIRWITSPETFQRLITEQVKWLRKKQSALMS